MIYRVSVEKTQIVNGMKVYDYIPLRIDAGSAEQAISLYQRALRQDGDGEVTVTVETGRGF